MSTFEQTYTERVWEIVEKSGICMLTTHFSGGLRARPMEARPDPEEDAIWFLTDRRGLKDDEIKTHPDVCLAFFYGPEKVYLSISGKATARRDPGRAQVLWNKKQEAWWEGPDDPNLLVMRVDPLRGEMWDGPSNSAIAAFEFAKARVTGQKPNVGEKRKVNVDMR
ncbi:MAG: pyridoxamine 5'-phosphate oxidase family protein [Methyloceanibacter sp.]